MLKLKDKIFLLTRFIEALMKSSGRSTTVTGGDYNVDTGCFTATLSDDQPLTPKHCAAIEYNFHCDVWATDPGRLDIHGL